jgi:hypothetical protein
MTQSQHSRRPATASWDDGCSDALLSLSLSVQCDGIAPREVCSLSTIYSRRQNLIGDRACSALSPSRCTLCRRSGRSPALPYPPHRRLKFTRFFTSLPQEVLYRLDLLYLELLFTLLFYRRSVSYAFWYPLAAHRWYLWVNIPGTLSGGI